MRQCQAVRCRKLRVNSSGCVIDSTAEPRLFCFYLSCYVSEETEVGICQVSSSLSDSEVRICHVSIGI